MATARRVKKCDPQNLIDEQVAQLDEALEKIEAKMKPYEELNQKKQQLLAARRALLGHGPRLTGGTTTRLTLDDVVDFVKNHPGCIPSDLAQHFGVPQTTVGSHLYRNKTRFVVKDGKYWVRDPKAGIDTADDIPEEDDE